MAFLRVYLGRALQEQHELTADRTSIGRASDNDIVLGGTGVSKHHAVVEKRGNKFVLRDNKSANGTLVNGRRVLEHALRYRDEIQIIQNTLVFMPLAKLPGEAEGAFGSQGKETSQDATMVADASDIGYLLRQRQQKSVGQLLVLNAEDGDERHVLDQAKYTIGRARNCDFRIRGWFAPRIAATLQQRHEGHYLIPGKRGRVQVNSQIVTEMLRLKDNDRFSVRELSFRFYFRPIK